MNDEEKTEVMGSVRGPRGRLGNGELTAYGQARNGALMKAIDWNW